MDEVVIISDGSWSDEEDEEKREKSTKSESSKSKSTESDNSPEITTPLLQSHRRIRKTRSLSPNMRNSSPPPKKLSLGALPEEDVEEQTMHDDEEKTTKVSKCLPYYPGIQGCRSVAEFQCLNRIEEGTYGIVYRARDLRTLEVVALKRLKMEREKEGFPITSLREINTLLKAQHLNIVTVREIVVGSNMDKIFIVMDYVEHDLKSLMEMMKHKKQCFLLGEVKCLLQQLLRAVAHLHDNWILHRDLKTSNLLLSHKGILKVGDFGLAREYGSPLRTYTPIVVTLWYRSPELLLGCKEYSTAIDMWSVGCIFAELLKMTALFPGKSEVDQLNRIFKCLGTPNEKIWPGYTSLPAVKKITFTEYPVSVLANKFPNIGVHGLDLLNSFLTYDPGRRITGEDALRNVYFKEPPLPIEPAMFPTWPAKSELGVRKAFESSPKAPSGGDQFKALSKGEAEGELGFHWGPPKGMTLLETRDYQMGAGFSLKF